MLLEIVSCFRRTFWVRGKTTTNKNGDSTHTHAHARTHARTHPHTHKRTHAPTHTHPHPHTEQQQTRFRSTLSLQKALIHEQCRLLMVSADVKQYERRSRFGHVVAADRSNLWSVWPVRLQRRPTGCHTIQPAEPRGYTERGKYAHLTLPFLESYHPL